MGSFIFHTVFFLNFPLSGSWFCTLSRGQIDGSWFDHQKLWALLMGFYCVSISTHFVLFWHRGLRWPLYNPHSNPRSWHILSGLHWTTCSFQMWIPTQSVPRSSEKKSIIQHYNIQSWRGGYKANFLLSVIFLILHHFQNTYYLLNITFIFDRCHRS